MSYRDVTYCLGMAKETLVEQNGEGAEQKQRHVKFVEFLEVIGRAADLRFQGSELESEPLNTKIEFLLDDLFRPFGLTRCPVWVEALEETDSDSDY